MKLIEYTGDINFTVMKYSKAETGENEVYCIISKGVINHNICVEIEGDKFGILCQYKFKEDEEPIDFIEGLYENLKELEENIIEVLCELKEKGYPQFMDILAILSIVGEEIGNNFI